MSDLHVELSDEKHLRITGVNPALAYCLFDVPEILRLRDQAEPHERLFPDLLPGDPEANAEWHRLMDGDLYHLLASAGDVMTRDLTQFDPEQGEVTFPAEHIHAWMSALNQARLILGAKFQVAEADMDQQDLNVRDSRQKALLQIHLLGWLLELLIQIENPNSI